MDTERLSKLILAVTDAPLRKGGWDTAAGEMVLTFQAESCCIEIRDAVSGMTQIVGKTTGLDATLVEDYTVWHYKRDVMTNRALQRCLNKAAIGYELIDDDELITTEFYEEFCRPQNIFHCLCGTHEIGNNCISLIKLYRKKGAAAFTEEEKIFLGHVLPHLKNAMRFHNTSFTASQEQKIIMSAIDQLSLGVIIVGLNGLVRFTNKTIERMLRSELGIAIRHGRLAFDDANAQQTLQKALQRAQEKALGSMITLRDKSERPISLLICPLSSGEKGAWPVGVSAAIYINNPDERRKPREDAISKLYGLTPAEARLARALLEGDRLQDYSERIGISLHTTKTQLKQIFQKTGHSRQSDLVRDIMSNPVLRMRL